MKYLSNSQYNFLQLHSIITSANMSTNTTGKKFLLAEAKEILYCFVENVISWCKTIGLEKPNLDWEYLLQPKYVIRDATFEETKLILNLEVEEVNASFRISLPISVLSAFNNFSDENVKATLLSSILIQNINLFERTNEVLKLKNIVDFNKMQKFKKLVYETYNEVALLLSESLGKQMSL